MNRSIASRRARGFTLVEIMIVTLIVAILTGLSAFVIGRIKQRAALSLIENNLRQLYQAKEFYYAETGASQAISIVTLDRTGYLSKRVATRLLGHDALEEKLGWRYFPVLRPNEPVFATRGRVNADGRPEGEAIYYPGKAGDTPDPVSVATSAVPNQVPQAQAPMQVPQLTPQQSPSATPQLTPQPDPNVVIPSTGNPPTTTVAPATGTGSGAGTTAPKPPAPDNTGTHGNNHPNSLHNQGKGKG